MDPEDADQAPEARPPLLEDLVSLCRDLNHEGARYVVIGGMAIIQAGFGRATNDIDLLIDTSQDNQDRVRKALMALPDQAVRDMTPDDLEKYVVVRVADEIVIEPGKGDNREGQTEETAGEEIRSDEELQALWLRRVETRPADFLRAKFAFQLAAADADIDTESTDEP